ncbi:ERGIC53, mannose lectin, ER-golgi intermediate compartment [Lentinula boryana]|uniref:ERGIC53, mannose lectin, ER-golgi intermediate compartment n=1 Tax=Lentinula boryana TaxID=40481 RepID=A0ABQ8QDA4_9AGAR|nr:ERGIC53, mannose lectin, ER-golgi intermediate compartment [Lentinula boryana]
MLSTYLWSSILAILSLIGLAKAAADTVPTKIGNQTIDRTVQLRTHSLFAPYIDQDLQNRWWDFGADSYVNTNKHIRLTRNRPSQMGWLWSRLPLTSQNFVVEVEFKVSGESGHLHGDGMAVWLTTERTQPGPVFGSKNQFTGLGLFLDTYANARHTYAFPRVTAILGDGKLEYNYSNDGDGQEIGACSANYRRTNIATKLKITYVKDTFLDVKIQYQAWDEWTDCFYVEGISLPASPFLGFSAMTGDVSDAHDVIAVTTSSAITSAITSNTSKSTPRTKIPGVSSSTWTGFFFKLFLFIGICVGGYYGWMEYQRRNRYGGGMSNFGGMSMNGGGGFGGMYANPKRF